MIGRISGWLRAQLEHTGSTRGLAVTRLLIMGVVLFRSLMPIHATRIGPPEAKVTLILLVLAALFAFIGYRTRIAMAAVALLFGVLHIRYGLLDGNYFLSRGVHLWQVVLALSMTPAGRSFSVDRWLAVRRARARGLDPPAEEGPLWGVWLFAILLSCMYLWAGSDKLDAAWFAGDRVDRLWINNYASSDAYARYPTLLRLGAIVSACSVTALELALGVGLLIPRARPYMPILGLLLHLSIWLLLGVWPFTISCIACYGAIASPSGVHRFFDGLRALPERLSNAAEASPPSRGFIVGLRVLGFLLFAAWCSQGPARQLLKQHAKPKRARSALDETLGKPWSATLLDTASTPACDIQYYRRVDGEDRRIRHWRQFPYNPRENPGVAARRVTRRSLESHTRELCNKLQRRHKRARIDIRGVIRCPRGGAWEQVEDGSQNLCERRDAASTRPRRSATRRQDS